MRVSLAFAVGSDVLEIHWAVPIVAVGSSCGSKLPLFNGLVGLGDGGSVSEEVRVTSATRKALRGPAPPARSSATIAGGDVDSTSATSITGRGVSSSPPCRTPSIDVVFRLARNRDLRVRSGSERSMIKGSALWRRNYWLDMTEFMAAVPPSEGSAPIGTIDPDPQSSSEDF
ncbi:hypothetical protein Dimus_005579 [Dionaea muscipula]